MPLPRIQGERKKRKQIHGKMKDLNGAIQVPESNVGADLWLRETALGLHLPLPARSRLRDRYPLRSEHQQTLLRRRQAAACLEPGLNHEDCIQHIVPLSA